jgi:hypothetical protein
VTALPPLPETTATTGQALPLQPNQPVRLLPLASQTEVLPAPPATVFKNILPVAPSAAQSSAPPTPEPQDHLLPAAANALPEETGAPPRALSLSPSTPSFVERLSGKLSEFLSGGLPKAASNTASFEPQTANRQSPTAQIISGKPLQFDALVKAVLPPGAQPLPETQTAPGQITATVIGFTKQGLPVLSVPLAGGAPSQEFVLQFPAAGLETGVKIALSPQITGAFIQDGAPEGLTPLSLDPAMSEWPALQSLNAALGQMSPQAAQILAQILPNPATPGQLPAAAILFLSVIQGGNLSLWMGDKTIDLLRRSGKTDLLSRLAGDMDTAKNASSQNVTQDWKAIPLPLYYEGQIDKTMLWFRQDDSRDKDDDKKNKQTRFIMDLNLNRMGAVQLDGLAKQQRIDLIVRTTRPVSDSMRLYMRQRYLHALDRAEYSGELSFQNRADQFVKIDARGRGNPFSA